MTAKYSRDQPAGFTNRIERVAITGAGGQFGKHITAALLATGHFTVTALTRRDSPTSLPAGVHVIPIDYTSPSSSSHAEDADANLVTALRNQQVLIITMAVTAAPDTVTRLVRAARRAGVAYVFPNWFGHDPANDALCGDVFLASLRDALLAAFTDDAAGSSNSSSGSSSSSSSTAYILLACNFWYEFSLGGGEERYGFDFQKRALTWFDDGDVRINHSTWPLCGRAVAQILSLKEFPEHEGDRAATLSGFRNKTVYISSFRVNQREMFESVKRVTGTTDADWTFTRESPRRRWEEAHAAVERGEWAEFPKQLYSRMFFPNGDGDFESRVTLHNEVLGLPVEDLDEATAVAVRMDENAEVSKEARAAHAAS